MHNLAIVIPAYKLTFLEDALKSISSQANKNFTLYIGDDNSPDDLYAVVEKYEKIIDIVYKKFEENLGAITLVAHWNRCVEMIASEKWIWLFSDDDIMKEDSVELFYKALDETAKSYDLYRFNCSIIDEAGNEVNNRSQYPQIQTAYEFLLSRLSYQYHNYIVNCVFSRNVYDKYNGFVDFYGAWAADDATWILYGEEKNIFTLENGLVQWRTSSLNISGNTNDLHNRQNKYLGGEQFIEWIYDWAHSNNKMLDDKLVMKWFWLMLSLLGFKNRLLVYLKSKTFRTFFGGRNLRFQISLFLKN